MTIGELAQQAGVNIQTVRYYERRGLLPAPRRTAGGYRSYCEHDRDRLQFIAGAKRLGFTLGEIRELLELRVDRRRTADDVRRHAQAKIAETEAKIAALEGFRAALQRLVASCDAHGSPDECALMHSMGRDLKPEGAV